MDLAPSPNDRSACPGSPRFDAAERLLEFESSGGVSQGDWCKTFDTIFQLPYWYRMWIVQEVASNRNVLV
ncbi:uncharacterized protein M421DRAFT_421673 [Didymella exigua CBS 183.55]|uniref:Heterokaryon incompatibility domain-containing protein n=1 Tax=Didymella exigua CBS 183.55 TaxID=1150837 RepID=A0A6A5RJ51_9PLEO|nr:uncharacterized protein M421DRAFT_421673 [Didymella exigua CBS 183.55]KAF1927280.1 hypothetical protein M421DRAFT_421673 [Didymella exigua CBS 183.55]